MSDDANNAAAGRIRRATTAGVWVAFLLVIGLVMYLDRPDVGPREAAPGDRTATEKDREDSEFGVRNSDQEVKQVAPPRRQRPRDDDPSSDNAESTSSTRIENVTVRGRDGRVEFRGTVDLGPTLARIERGERLRFEHDGSTFSNRERRLPQQPGGYYHEYVHPTPGDSGPGAQRVIVGRRGEVYYTFDHYRTFRRIK